MDINGVLVTVVTIFVAGYFFIKKKYRYWEDRNIPYIKPIFPYGIVKSVGSKKHTSQVFQEAYNQLKGKDVFGGFYIYIQPVVLATNLDFLKNILVKDFQYFTDRTDYINEKDDPLTGHLISLKGERWKSMRSKVSPTFTSGKMKMMHSTVLAIAKEFQKYLQPFAEKNQEIEIDDVLARFSTDIIGSCSLGIDCNSLKDPNAEFRKILSKMKFNRRLDSLKTYLRITFPNFCRRLKIKSNKAEISDFFFRVLKETVEYREKNNVQGNDLVNLLMKIMKTEESDDENCEVGKITFEQLTAQAFIFLVGGSGTLSSTITFALYELALNQNIQDDAREEIVKILSKHNGELTYDACMEMKYLDLVIKETMRKYPVVDLISRLCCADYKVPGTKHVIEKGTIVNIPIYAIQNDPDIYPDPERFDPNRFSEENNKSRHPCAYIPFGEGPRSCVGIRFGKMQTRIALASLLSKYRARLSAKTQAPIQIDPEKFLMSPKGGIWLHLETMDGMNT